MNVYFNLIDETAVLPSRQSKWAAGYDIHTIEYYELRPGERKLFKTGLKLEIPAGFYGRIAPRSGLAFKDGIDVLAGVIDSDYRGEIGVLLINLSDKTKIINKGDRIAQMIFEKCHEVIFVGTKTLSETPRMEGGFGSTDLNQKTQSLSETI